MKRSDDYGMGANHSSSGETPKYKEGSLDAMQNGKGYRKDMYDKLASKPKNASGVGAPNTGIQGSGGQNVRKDVTVTSNNGSDDYGKGNPFKKHKEKEPKVFKSIQQLKEYSKKKGYT